MLHTLRVIFSNRASHLIQSYLYRLKQSCLATKYLEIKSFKIEEACWLERNLLILLVFQGIVKGVFQGVYQVCVGVVSWVFQE